MSECNFEIIQRSNSALSFTGTISFIDEKSINVCIQCKEGIRVVKCSEKFSLHFTDSFNIKFKIIPWLRIADQIPACCIRSVFFNCFKRINSIAETLAHFVSVFIKHQSVAHYIFKCNRIKQHYCNCMKCKEPSACLVNTFGNKICGKFLFAYQFHYFKRIMPLCIRHCATVKPYINQIQFAEHFFS